MSSQADTGRMVEPGRRQRLAVLGLWLAVAVAYIVYMRDRDLTPLEAAEALRRALSGNAWGPALYIVVYALRPLVLFPASVLTILGGLAFGPVWGTVWTVVASNLSTAVAYGAGRFVIRGPVAERIAGLLGAWGDRARNNPLETAAIMRLLYLPFDAVGFVAGWLTLSFVPFMIGSFLGTLPGTMAFVGFGASVESLDAGTPSFDLRLLLASAALAVAGSVLSRVLRRSGLDVTAGADAGAGVTAGTEPSCDTRPERHVGGETGSGSEPGLVGRLFPGTETDRQEGSHEH